MFCYCAHSRRIARVLAARYDAALAPSGLTASQFELLNVVNHLRATSGRDLARFLVVDKTTLSRNLQPLIAAKLVASRAAKADARSVEYSLTARGSARLQRAMPLWQKVHAETEALLGNRAASTQRTLQRMTQVL